MQFAAPETTLEPNPLEELARRVRAGDSQAAAEFRREMSMALEGMLRLALRTRECFNPLHQYARAEVDRLQEKSDGQLPRHELARRAASRVCEDMIARLQACGRAQDTVACVAPLSPPLEETVLAGC
jgi:hypothetical protein